MKEVIFGSTALLVVSLALSLPAVAQDKDKLSLANTSQVAPASVKHADVSETYELGAGDVLAIHVYKEPELSRVLPIRPDGKLSLPLIGDIDATGFTVAQLQITVNQLYEKFLENPAVTIMVQEAHSKRFNVVGEVQKPGTFTLAQPTTVLDSLALAAGFRNFAKPKKVYVLRPLENGKVQRIPFNYVRVIKGESPQENILLQPGDTVVVP
jgi:polysaccharide export outer membrane protein